MKFASARWDGVQPCARARTCGIKKERQRRRRTETKHDTPRKFTSDVPVALENTSFSLYARVGSYYAPEETASNGSEERRQKRKRDERKRVRHTACIRLSLSLALAPPFSPPFPAFVFLVIVAVPSPMACQ